MLVELRDQMDRLFRASISFDRTTTEGERAGNTWLNMEITSGGEMWWSPRDPSQAALWGSWVELGEKFFRAIIATPVPLDMRALKALKQSPLALDLYSWLSYELYRVHKSGKGRFVAWKLLAEQIGTDYARTTDFQHKAVPILRKIQALYPALKLGPLRGGIRIEPGSLPAITPRLTPTIEHAGKPYSLPAVTPRPIATVEHVRKNLQTFTEWLGDEKSVEVNDVIEALKGLTRFIEDTTPR